MFKRIPMPSLLFSLLLHLSSLFALPSIPSPSLFLQGYPLLKDSHSQINSETLNTLTHLSAIEAQEVLQEVVSIAGSQDGDTEGFIAKLSIYNNEEMTKGYAYSAKGSKAEKGKESKTKKEARGAKQEEWIGFNTRTNDLTNPNEVINTLFHETSNKQKHHKAEQGGKDTYAFIRGKTAENIFALKNYANTNTNTLTNTEWNTKYQSSKVFKQGNQLNKETWQRNAEGRGERDDKINPLYRNKQDKQNYEQAITYLNKSKDFQKIFKKLEDSENVYTILFNNEDVNAFSPLEYNGVRSEIHWDALGGLKTKQGNQSPATGLAHEMTHAYHYDNGEIRTRSSSQEEEITTKIEGKIAKELGEAMRRNYNDHNGSFRAIHPISTQERK